MSNQQLLCKTAKDIARENSQYQNKHQEGIPLYNQKPHVNYLGKLLPTEFYNLPWAGSGNRRNRGRLGGVLPSDVTGLKLWLDADDLSTITKDGSDFVSQWNDKSAEGNNVSQATGSLQPKWINSVQNGKPIIRFDGVDDGLQRTSFTGGAILQGFTYFIIAKIGTATNSGYVIDGGSATRAIIYTTGTPSPNDTYHWNAGTDSNPITPKITSTFVLYSVQWNGASSKFEINESTISTDNIGSGSMNGVTLGRRYTGGPSALDIDYAEVLFYDSILSASDHQAVENYLKTKWGV